MSALLLLTCCPKVVANTDWNPLINALPGICWGILTVVAILVALYVIVKNIFRPFIANRHEIDMKKEMLANEEKTIVKNQEIKDKELERKIREYNELTIHQKLLEKATGIDKDIDDLKKELEKMKKQYETLDGQIENIIIKKSR